MASTINISLPEPLSSYVEQHLLNAIGEDSQALEVSDEDWQHGDIVALMESHAPALHDPSVGDPSSTRLHRG
jgi:hypothetical protein